MQQFKVYLEREMETRRFNLSATKNASLFEVLMNRIADILGKPWGTWRTTWRGIKKDEKLVEGDALNAYYYVICL